MTIKCILHTQTGLCVNIIDDQTDTYTAPDGYSVAPDNTGQIFWYWDGDNWYNPTNQYYNAYLGSVQADTPDVSSEDNSVATTFYVRQKIEDYINNIFLPNLILDGGDFADAAASVTYDAGLFDDTGSNLSGNLHATLFDDTGGTLTSNVHADTF